MVSAVRRQIDAAHARHVAGGSSGGRGPLQLQRLFSPAPCSCCAAGCCHPLAAMASTAGPRTSNDEGPRSLGQHIATRLVQIGVTEFFGVPGVRSGSLAAESWGVRGGPAVAGGGGAAHSLPPTDPASTACGLHPTPPALFLTAFPAAAGDYNLQASGHECSCTPPVQQHTCPAQLLPRHAAALSKLQSRTPSHPNNYCLTSPAQPSFVSQQKLLPPCPSAAVG